MAWIHGSAGIAHGLALQAGAAAGKDEAAPKDTALTEAQIQEARTLGQRSADLQRAPRV